MCEKVVHISYKNIGAQEIEILQLFVSRKFHEVVKIFSFVGPACFRLTLTITQIPRTWTMLSICKRHNVDSTAPGICAAAPGCPDTALNRLNCGTYTACVVS